MLIQLYLIAYTQLILDCESWMYRWVKCFFSLHCLCSIELLKNSIDISTNQDKSDISYIWKISDMMKEVSYPRLVFAWSLPECFQQLADSLFYGTFTPPWKVSIKSGKITCKAYGWGQQRAVRVSLALCVHWPYQLIKLFLRFKWQSTKSQQCRTSASSTFDALNALDATRQLIRPSHCSDVSMLSNQPWSASV